MKRFILSISLVFGLLNSPFAQLPNYSVAPDWNLTDLDGNDWHLYELLSQGKYVFIDISATWCGPCWDFHQSGKAEQLWNLYGPDGTDEMMVFTIEADDDTNIDCIYGLNSCNNSTWGDWTAGVSYPFINDDNIAADYQISGYPTLYFICPSLTTFQVSPNASVAQIYNLMTYCPQVNGINNAGIIDSDLNDGEFCDNIDVNTQILFQNLGTGNLSSLVANLSVDNTVVETKNWNGDLDTYQMGNLSFSPFNITTDSDVSIDIVSVNGGNDDDNSNNSIDRSYFLSPITPDNYITLEIMTDEYPFETYWELLDENFNALYTGGNIGIFDDDPYVHVDSYLEENMLYTHELPLPFDGCYSFVIYDFFGDGIAEFGGYYNIKDSEGNVLQTGGDFGFFQEDYLEISGSAMGIYNNAAIVLSQGYGQNLCGTDTIAPSVLVQNVGSNDITELTLEASGISGTLATVTSMDTINPGNYAVLQFDPYAVHHSIMEQTFAITSVNEVADTFDFKNTMVRMLDFPVVTTQEQMLTLEIQTDNYGYETYWQITDHEGNLVDNGGNLNVGPDGGGQQSASPADPGAYASNTTIIEQILLPNDSTDCYEFLIVDDWGDGFIDFNGNQQGSFTLKEQDGTILFTGSENTFAALSGRFTYEGLEAIPVTLLSFDAFQKSEHVMLEWKSTSEYNNYGFEIYHSRDARSWNQIGFVPAAVQASDINHYQHSHYTPSKGFNYYRLKQIDHNGQYSFSDIRMIEFANLLGHSQFLIYPTVTNQHVTIEALAPVPGKLEVRLMNMNAQIVYETNWSDTHSNLTLDLAEYTAGIYTVLIKADQEIIKSRIIKF